MIKQLIALMLMLFILLPAVNAFSESRQLTFEIEGMD